MWSATTFSLTILVAKLHRQSRIRPALALVVLLLGVVSCERQPSAIQLTGQVFGTGWSLLYLPGETVPDADTVEAQLLEAFDVVNRSMNTYDASSTISRFNALPPGEVMEVDWDFTYVFNEARKLSQATGGAYDVTVLPLVSLWGFGPDGPRTFPEAEAVAAARERVGLGKIEWRPSTRELSKRVEGVALEFSSIAKGYGVDLAADALDELGIEHFMLEVGGELQLRGMSPRGDAWRIAVERPGEGRSGVQAAVALTNVGVATSGDYRNYFEHEGRRYSHLIDPRSGYPIDHDVVSVTVVHGSTALADAWATALSILGSKSAMEHALQHGLAVYILRRSGETLEADWTPQFEEYLVSSPTPG